MRNCHDFLLSLGFDHNILEFSVAGLMKSSCSYLLCYKWITVTVSQSFFFLGGGEGGVGGECNSFIYYDCPPIMPMTKKIIQSC